jgi:exodeoxyribonuclease III
MADIRTFFAAMDEPAAKRAKVGGAADSAAPLPPLDPAGPRTFLSWNVDGLEARDVDGKLAAFLQAEAHALPDIVAFQETWSAWETQKRGDLRSQLYAPRREPSVPAAPSPSKRDSLGLDDGEDEVLGNPPAVNVTGRLDPHASRLLPPSWAEALPHGYWSCCSYKRRAGVGVLSRIEPLRVEWSFPGILPEYATEGRYICLEFERCFVANVYVPNTGQDRLDARAEGWDTPLRAHLRALDARKPVIVLGDFNVCHRDIDLTHPEFMATSGRGRGPYAPQPGVRDREREGFGLLLSEGGVDGLVDAFREREPDNRQCSWRGTNRGREGSYSAQPRYAGMGMRLDYVRASRLRCCPAAPPLRAAPASRLASRSLELTVWSVMLLHGWSTARCVDGDGLSLSSRSGCCRRYRSARSWVASTQRA